MIKTTGRERPRAAEAPAWPPGARSAFDVVAALEAGLPGGWQTLRETDPDGDLSVVVFAAEEAVAAPSFVLYEQDGCARVGTVRQDAWAGSRGFTACRDAVAAIIAAAKAQK